MASLTLGPTPRSVLRTSGWDALMVMLAAAHAAVLFAAPTAPVIALGLWWNSNTISHNFIHRPFFRQRSANLMFGAYLTVLLGIPQSLWRDRHLAHHAGRRRPMRLTGELAFETGLVLSFWAALATWSPAFFLSVYLPGYVVGLGLCVLHGHYEHARGTASHYGALYNLLLFNDGYHVEHHAHPGLHWTRLPEYHETAARASAWPAPLRWMEIFSLEALERLVLRSRALQRFVLRAHARAFRSLASELPRVDRVAIVGGGLFPRTALILQELLPAARITIIDANRANLDRARALLAGSGIEYVHAHYTGSHEGAYDLVVIPLSYDEDRGDIYARPPAAAVIIHDWIWRKRGASRLVSVALLKRLNLVRR
jgi:fatty acid desaturase